MFEIGSPFSPRSNRALEIPSRTSAGLRYFAGLAADVRASVAVLAVVPFAAGSPFDVATHLASFLPLNPGRTQKVASNGRETFARSALASFPLDLGCTQRCCTTAAAAVAGDNAHVRVVPSAVDDTAVAAVVVVVELVDPLADAVVSAAPAAVSSLVDAAFGLYALAPDSFPGSLAVFVY